MQRGSEGLQLTRFFNCLRSPQPPGDPIYIVYILGSPGGWGGDSKNRGESWHSIQTLFNTIEYRNMKVLGHVFDQTTGSNNTQNDNRVVLDIGSHQGLFNYSSIL